MKRTPAQHLRQLLGVHVILSSEAWRSGFRVQRLPSWLPWAMASSSGGCPCRLRRKTKRIERKLTVKSAVEQTRQPAPQSVYPAAKPPCPMGSIAHPLFYPILSAVLDESLRDLLATEPATIAPLHLWNKHLGLREFLPLILCL